jgi:hypothetical protein
VRTIISARFCNAHVTRPLKARCRYVAASIKKPIHNVKERADPSSPRRKAAKFVSSSLEYGCARPGLRRTTIRRIAVRMVEPIGIEPMTSSLQS